MTGKGFTALVEIASDVGRRLLRKSGTDYINGYAFVDVNADVDDNYDVDESSEKWRLVGHDAAHHDDDDNNYDDHETSVKRRLDGHDAAQAVRCRFGTEVQATPPQRVSDTEVVCISTWGQANRNVSVALNGATFLARAARDATSFAAATTYAASTPAFTFVGMKPPVLLEAYFDPEGTRLITRFDSQPTNRAGMNGLDLCPLQK